MFEPQRLPISVIQTMVTMAKTLDAGLAATAIQNARREVAANDRNRELRSALEPSVVVTGRRGTLTA